VQSGRAGDRVVPLLPSRAPGTSRSTPGVGLQAGEDGVADLPFQCAQGLFRGLAVGQLLVVVRAALAVPVADLGDRHHVDGVVEAPVSAPAQPVDLALAGGHLDRRGAVVSGEVVPAAEAGHVADVADDQVSGRGESHPPATHLNSRSCMAPKFWRTSSQRRPDLLGAVAAFSVGVVLRQISGASRSARARHYLAAGTLKPGFRRSTREWAERLRRAGLRCRHEEWIGGHDQVWWQQQLPVALGWLLRA